ncbi:hypothetical protein A4F85_06990 [Delftia sp. GW456-R20]|nr:hypothetical protein A4F85_06990 [Delftia sp. GW456-R20]
MIEVHVSIGAALHLYLFGIGAEAKLELILLPQSLQFIGFFRCNSKEKYLYCILNFGIRTLFVSEHILSFSLVGRTFSLVKRSIA